MRTVHVGLGPIGQACLRVAAARPGLAVVAVIDADPALAGQDAGIVAGLPTPLGVPIAADWTAVPPADAAIVCTTSRVADLRPVVGAAFERGLDVVTTCEPLVGPAADDLDAAALDVLARRWGRRLLGIGANPGFVLDLVPLVLSAAQHEVRTVRVRRVVDLATRRPQLAAKAGVGLDREAFASAARCGQVGHVGLAASARLIAAGIGWTVDDLRESMQPLFGPDGRCRGIMQQLRAWVAGEPRIQLALTLAMGARASRDEVWLEGRPPVRWATRPATHGDEATAALVVNALLALPALPPGLRTVLDFAPLRYRAGAPAAPAFLPGGAP